MGGLGTLCCISLNDLGGSTNDLGGSTEQLKGANDPLPPVLSTDRCVTDLPGLIADWFTADLFIRRLMAMNALGRADVYGLA